MSSSTFSPSFASIAARFAPVVACSPDMRMLAAFDCFGFRRACVGIMLYLIWVVFFGSVTLGKSLNPFSGNIHVFLTLVIRLILMNRIWWTYNMIISGEGFVVGHIMPLGGSYLLFLYMLLDCLR